MEHRETPLCSARMPSRATYQTGQSGGRSIRQRVVGEPARPREQREGEGDPYAAVDLDAT